MPSGKGFDFKCEYLTMNSCTIWKLLSLRQNSDDLFPKPEFVATPRTLVLLQFD